MADREVEELKKALAALAAVYPQFKDTMAAALAYMRRLEEEIEQLQESVWEAGMGEDL